MYISIKNDASNNPNFNTFSHCEKVDFLDLPEKICTQQWSPNEFKDNIRTKATFLSTNLIVFDIDEGLSLEKVIDIAKKSGLRAIVAITRNHGRIKITAGGQEKPACDRMRVIFETAETITDEKNYLKYYAAGAKLITSFDTACRDLARFFYPCKEIVYSNYSGELLTLPQTPQVMPRLTVKTLNYLSVGKPKNVSAWHDSLVLAATNFCKAGYSIEEALEKLLNVPGDPQTQEEIIKQTNWAYKNNSPLPGFTELNKNGAGHKIIVPILAETVATDPNFNFIRFNGEYWHRAEGATHFKRCPDDLAVGKVLNHLLKNTEIKTASNSASLSSVAKETLLHITNDKTFYEINPPFDISSGSELKWHIPFKNGLLDVSTYLVTGNLMLIPHRPDIFINYCLPFDFEKDASSELWENILSEILPEPADQDVLMQWFGYNLIPWCDLEKWMILKGEGANGKTVATSVLSALLGHDAVSSSNLAQLGSSHGLEPIVGKLANISDELTNDVFREDIVKAVVSGNSMTVNPKGTKAYRITPTVRLTFSTNELPYFKGRTKGDWRRLIILPFTQEITKRNPNYKNINWWMGSGELPGIFNWALAGLMGLWLNKEFTLSENVAEAVEEAVGRFNPAKAWLKENLEPGENATELSCDIYIRFEEDMRGEGRHKIPIEATLREELLKIFKDAKKGRRTTSTRFGKVRNTYIIHGVKLI